MLNTYRSIIVIRFAHAKKLNNLIQHTLLMLNSVSTLLDLVCVYSLYYIHAVCSG